MIFVETPLANAYVVEPERLADERGFFARIFEPLEFEAYGLNPNVKQSSLSFNPRKGTLRGMHFQHPPFAEAKLVRCTRGAVHDVIIDLRRESKTYLGHLGVELDAESRRMLYVPEGFAHGFLTMTDDAEVTYQISARYSPDHASGVRWNDPAFGIEWPGPVVLINERDRSYPDYRP
jgi:dTDP-4-dehydrorhamnose 3,5-epimerase